MSQLRNIIITGCNQGIGLGLVKKLASLSQYNIIMACRNMEKAKQAKQNVMKLSPNASMTVQQLDVSESSSISSFVQKLTNNKKNIDILVNNAGIAGPMNSQDPEFAKKVFRTNFYGPIELSESLLPIISKNGRILFSGGYIGKLNQIKNKQYKEKFNSNLDKDKLVSLMDQYLQKVQDKSFGKDGLPKWFYMASKIGINHYPQVLKDNPTVIQKNISTYSYCPGWTKTQMTGNKGKQTVEEALSTPMFLIELKNEECKKQEQGGFFQKCALSKL